MTGGQCPKDRLYEVARFAEGEARLFRRFSQLGVEELADTECFPCVDECILIAIMKEIVDDMIRVDAICSMEEKAEGLYSHWFLGQLGSHWSDICAEDLQKYGHVPGGDQQVDLCQDKVRGADNRVYVIISDALRYDVGSSLAEQLDR